MAALSNNMRGALLMTLSMAGFTFNDAVIKAVFADLEFFQSVLIRGAMVAAFLALLAWRAGQLWYRPTRRDAVLIGLRALGEVSGTVFFLTALLHMPLANATAILQVLPLAVTLGAAWLLNEPVGWRRYLAIMAGFIGVLIIVRPGSDGFNIYSISALAAVCSIVLRDLATRKLSAEVPSLFTTLLSACAVLSMAAVMAPTEEWAPMSPGHFGLLALAAIFLMGGYLFGVMTMRVGDIGFSSPFRYTALVWAILMGALFFDEWPDRWTSIGSAIIVAAGLYTLYRERRRRLDAIRAPRSGG